MSQNDSSTMTANMISRKPYTPRGVSTVWEGVEISPFYVEDAWKLTSCTSH